MKKSFNKGFVLAETIIISVVIITALIVVYIQFITLNNSYNRSFKYNSVDDLYAVNNVVKFIESESLNTIINKLDSNYIDLSSCSADYFKEYNYCKTLLEYLDIKTVIFTYEDVTELKNELSQNNTLSEGMYTFIKTISTNKNNKYRLIVEFNNDRYATLKLGSFLVSNLSNECAKEGNTCSINQIKTGVSMNVSVSDNESYSFNVINDDCTNLTLIMNDSFEDDVIWNTNPTNLLEYLDAKVSNWYNVLDITYSLSGTNSNSYNNCISYDNCSDNTYSVPTKNSKARLPMVQELVSLGCTNLAGSCPSWLGNNLNSSNNIGYWTSTTNGSNKWYISYDNRLNTTSDSNNIKIRPIIMINKKVLD